MIHEHIAQRVICVCVSHMLVMRVLISRVGDVCVYVMVDGCYMLVTVGECFVHVWYTVCGRFVTSVNVVTVLQVCHSRGFVSLCQVGAVCL